MLRGGPHNNVSHYSYHQNMKQWSSFPAQVAANIEIQVNAQNPNGAILSEGQSIIHYAMKLVLSWLSETKAAAFGFLDG
jgi:hypothetical protein